MEHRKENSREKKEKKNWKIKPSSLFFFSASFLTKSVVDIFESNQADREPGGPGGLGSLYGC